MSGFFVHHIRRLELFPGWIFQITEKKYIGFFLTRRKRDVNLVCGDGGPAARDRVRALASHHSLRFVSAVVHTDKTFAYGIKTVHIGVDSIDGIMIAALTVLCLVIDCRADDLHLAGAQIPLEISGIIVGIPQTPLHIRKQRKFFLNSACVLELELSELTVVIHRNKGEDGRLHLIFGSRKSAVANAMTALITVKRCLAGLPSRIPDRAAVFYVKIFAVGIVGDIIVAVARQAQQFGIFVEGVAAAGI